MISDSTKHWNSNR